MRFLLFSVLLFVPAIVHPQKDPALPEAPSTLLKNARSIDSSPTEPAPNTAADDRPLDQPQLRLESTSRDGGFMARPVPAADADDYPYANENSIQAIRLDLDQLFASMSRPSTGTSFSHAGQDQTSERYHWKGLFWESFAFFGVENGFRLMTDPYLRHLTADDPFWHDYLASVKQWNWRRWDDGDDFLVAYIAHPMQGSVTDFIEIQNDPRARDLRIDDGKPYWKSQFHAFLWATAFSFDQKLGPLGEAAIGSEGGYTYVINCPFPCKTYVQGVNKVTNNTGDVKLVTTPVVGTLWTLVEDGIDHWISDPLQERFGDRVVVKIVRGSLNPCRTMANALRWRKPWYRDFQHDTINLKITRPPHFLPGDDAVILSSPRFELFPHYNAISLPVNTAGCSHCRQMTSGYGLGFSERIATYADLDSDLNYQPNASPLPSDRAGGNIIGGTFGLRSGYQNSHFALKASLRPGFLSYDKAYEASPSLTNPTPPIGRITHFTTALAMNGDYILNRHLALRIAGGNTAVRYREPNLAPPGPGTYPYLNWLSTRSFLTNENWTYQAGAVLRF
jgi:hypothetical protein